MDLNIAVAENPATDVKTISWSFGDCVGSFTFKNETELSAVRAMLEAVCAANWAEDYSEMMSETAATASVY